MTGAVRVQRDGGLASTLAAAIDPADPVSWLERHAQVVKRDRNSCVALLTLQQQPCFIKYYRARSALQGLWLRHAGGRAVRAYDAALALGRADLPVPRPLACLALPGGQLLLTEAVTGGRDLRSLWQAGVAAGELETLMAGAARTLARLHRAGFSHGDCKWSNLLWSDSGFQLIDLEGVRQPGAKPWPGPRDLARFVLNGEDLGLPAAAFRHFTDGYSAALGRPWEQLQPAVLPVLRRLRRRHHKSYGARGHRLLPE